MVPVKNAVDTIGDCIESLLALDYPSEGLELVFVDDRSTDGTLDILRAHRAAIRILSTDSDPESIGIKGLEPGDVSGSSRAKNLGALSSKSEIVAFTDADCTVDPQWLKELVEPFTDPKVVSCGGMQQPGRNDPPFARVVNDFLNVAGMFGGYTKNRAPLARKSVKEGLRRVRHNPTCCSAYRRRVFDYLFFDESLWPGEDLDFDIRLQQISPGIIVFNHKALVYHRRPRTFERFLRMIFAYGRFSGGRLTRRYGLFRPLCFVPLATVLLAFYGRRKPGITLAIGAALLVRMISLLKSPDRILRVATLIPFGLTAWMAGFSLGFLEEGS